MGLQGVELLRPEGFVVGEPVLRCPEAMCIESDHTATSFAFAVDQVGALEDVEVLGDGGERHAVGLSDLADRLLAVGDVPQDGSAGGIGQGVEDGVERGGAVFNHVVECMPGRD